MCDRKRFTIAAGEVLLLPCLPVTTGIGFCLFMLAWLRVTAGVTPPGGTRRLVRPVGASGIAGAGADVGADAYYADVDVGTSDEDDENDEKCSSGLFALMGETLPHGNLLCR